MPIFYHASFAIFGTRAGVSKTIFKEIVCTNEFSLRHALVTRIKLNAESYLFLRNDNE
jgi:hypothetical protein